MGRSAAVLDGSAPTGQARTVDAWDLAANLAGIALGGLSATRLTRVARL